MFFIRINVLLTTLFHLVVSNNLITYQLPIPDGLKVILGYPEDNLLDFTQLAVKYGYLSERHSVTTEDGYILKLYSMRSKHCKELIRPPVLLMHGLLTNSDIWMDSGPNKTLAYLLADHCYDLWVGNVRGNNLGRKHVELNPDEDAEFWDFCTEEIGVYDVPAIIDYVLKMTHSEKVNYVGHSQGGGIFVIMCSERPEYCDKVNTFVGLAPATRLLYSRSLLSRVLTKIIERFSEILSKIGIQELFFKGSFLQESLEFICKDEKSSAFCISVITLFDAYDPGSIIERTTQRMYAHFFVGTSRKNLVKYAQDLQSEKFQKFDYGPFKNQKTYGTEAPPAYDLSKLKIPVLIIQGLNDHIVDTKDSLWLREQLSNAELKLVDTPLWTHTDMVYSSFIPTLLFPSVHKQLLKYSRTSNMYSTPVLYSGSNSGHEQLYKYRSTNSKHSENENLHKVRKTNSDEPSYKKLMKFDYSGNAKFDNDITSFKRLHKNDKNESLGYSANLFLHYLRNLV